MVTLAADQGPWTRRDTKVMPLRKHTLSVVCRIGGFGESAPQRCIERSTDQVFVPAQGVFQAVKEVSSWITTENACRPTLAVLGRPTSRIGAAMAALEENAKGLGFT
jgi:hypothetical protein